MDGGVDFLQELHGVEIFAAAVLVGQPFAVFAGVIEVEHGCHGVNTQAINVELVEPVEGIGH